MSFSPSYYVGSDADLLFKDNILFIMPGAGSVWKGLYRESKHKTLAKYKRKTMFTFGIEFLISFPFFVRGLTNTRFMGDRRTGGGDEIQNIRYYVLYMTLLPGYWQ